MQNIDNAHIDHQSHRGDSERLWVGLGGHGSVSTRQALGRFGRVCRPLGLKHWLAKHLFAKHSVCKQRLDVLFAKHLIWFSTHSVPNKTVRLCSPPQLLGAQSFSRRDKRDR